MGLKPRILEMSRQNDQGPLSPWFDDRLDIDIAAGRFLQSDQLIAVADHLIKALADYRAEANISTMVLGMSGGVDSALTAALYKQAGWRVIGVTMPIHQAPIETERGVEACEATGIEHLHVDLSATYDAMVTTLSTLGHDPSLSGADNAASIRRGNIRARARMITLYNLASANKGLVASTDNLSELGAGFWTLHGDVGDLAPIQSLLKSWEVPMLAKHIGVPESTYKATPTDGLGIVAGSDEAQLGASYLEWDIMVFAMAEAVQKNPDATLSASKSHLALDTRADDVFSAVTRRMGTNWFKRLGTIQLKHPLADRYAMIDLIDRALFLPSSLR